MKNFSLLISTFFLFLLSSCTSRYQSTQTPDDLYYSPTEDLLVEKEVKNTKQKDDYYLQHKVNNRTRWSSIDDYCYWQDSRYFNNSWNKNSHWNSNNSWNNYSWGNYNCNCNCNNNFNNGFFYSHWNNPSHIFIAYYHPNFVKPFSTNNALTYSNPNYINTNYSYNFKTDKTTGTNINNDRRVRRNSTNNGESMWQTPSRTFSSGSTPSSSAGGNSGGFNSKGSSTSKPRG